MRLLKGHAYGNDFLLIEEQAVRPGTDVAALARALCDRHRGAGADGLMLFSNRPRGAAMRLINADGTGSELSGNGIRCLAAALARAGGLAPGAVVEIDTEAGRKTLELIADERGRFTFRAAMGQPEELAARTLQVAGEAVDVITLRVGNPQCVVLGEVSEARLQRLASRLAVDPAFPCGTNVELAMVEAPDRVRILIWERGVGPTQASGTGACAAAIAAAAYGGASRDVQVIAPGGAQRVEWWNDGVYLTGWAELLFEGEWPG